MTVTVDRLIDVSGDGSAWRCFWSSDGADPLYRIYRNGRFVRATVENSAVFTTRPGTWEVIEVVDDLQTPRRAAQLEAIITVAAAAGAAGYRIEELVDSVWSPLLTVDDDGSSEYSVTTPPLLGVQTYQFRVVPYDAAGNDGSPTAVTFEIKRHPDPPEVDYAFDDVTKTVTLTAL